MATAKRGLVDKVKRAVARASTRGAMTLVEGTAAAVRTVDKLQAKLASRGKQEKTNTVAEAAPAVSATPAPAPKRATPRANEAREKTAPRAAPRTSGRKTMPGTEAAAKRVRAPTAEAKTEAKAAPTEKKAQPQAGGFKVKRGQKHLHSRR